MKLESLWIYPIKSCAGIPQNQLQIDKGGPAWDRHWMIVDENGQFLSQRQLPMMSQIFPTLTKENLELKFGDQRFSISLEKPARAVRTVKVWKSVVEAWSEDEALDIKLSEFLGKKASLVRSPKSQRQYHIDFADSRPLQLANLDSLKVLSQAVGHDLSIDRFRANIVVSGMGAFAEDNLENFELGGITFEVSKPCIRCSIINVEPTTGVRANSEPLIQLKKIHPINNQPAFGILLVPKTKGILALP